MTDSGVWLATWTTSPSANYTGYQYPRKEEDLHKHGEAIRQSIEGNAPAPGVFPKRFVRKFDNSSLPRKPVFQIHGFPVVTAEAKELFEQFDIGSTRFYPVTIFEDQNERTVYPGAFFHFALGAQKCAFIPEESQKLNMGPRSQPIYIASGLEEDYSAVVRDTALKGFDIWHDPNLMNSLFLSQPVVDAISAKKWKRWFHLKKCKIKLPGPLGLGH